MPKIAYRAGKPVFRQFEKKKPKPPCKKKVNVGVRCYDNGGPDKPGGTVDRYTVVFTGRYRQYTGGEQMYLSMDENPFHPQGIGQHGSAKTAIDRPAYSHLGKQVQLSDLPQKCQLLVMADIKDLSEGEDS